MTLNLLPFKMYGKIHNYEAWEERDISEVNVQYYLRSLSGDSLLAAVGNKNSKGHMIYAVAEEYLEAFGSNATINAYTKWKKRRDVVKWLISLVRDDSSPPTKLDLDLFPKHQGDLSSIEATGIQAVEPKPRQPASFQVGEKIEVLCQDNGMRGCWFTCKIVKVSKNSFKVQYNDAHNVEASGKLEEWVPASRLADPDKLSLRHPGRLTVRPCPPKEPLRHFYEVGAAVESWWNNGWWESFVSTCVSFSSYDSYHVFLPGERRFLTLHCKDLRVAKDWIDNKWVAVKPHPDILSDICSAPEHREE